MPSYFDRSPSQRSMCPPTSWSVFLCVGSIVLGCSGGQSQISVPKCANECEVGCGQEPGSAGGHCGGVVADLPPLPKLRFQIQPPRDETDYPYGPDVLPAEGPIPHSTVFLSAQGSSDPEGTAVSVFWNVQDESREYLALDPDPGAWRTSFSPSGVGRYAITLEVTETGGLRQTGQTTLTLQVSPIPCARDGVAASCSDGLAVPGGTFIVGSTDGTGFDNEHPSHAGTVASFVLDKYEVTVGRFRRFLSAFTGTGPAQGAGAHPLIAGSGWQSEWNQFLPGTSDDFKFAIAECGGTWTNDIGPSEARPINCITWFEAFAYCVWEGRRLPTEAEWEYAAAGGSEHRTYPWGEAPPTSERAVFGCLFDGLASCSDADLPVGGSTGQGAGRWGHVDLAGSVWEWTLDVYAPYDGSPCDNCASLNESVGSGRVFRGGDFKFDHPSSLRAASRYGFDPAFPDQTRGFRCAR